MCTLTYIPTGNDEFILTQNRDEAPSRHAQHLVRTNRQGKSLLYPQDNGAGGTWIAMADSNQLVCILNGAFEKHKHQPPYRNSRGIMALEFFDFTDIWHFSSSYEFAGMEPFTMVVFDRDSLFDLRWDEKQVHLKELNVGEKHIWSSCTLYNKDLQQKRVDWFDAWQRGRTLFQQSGILDFHKTGGEGDPWNDLVMNRANRVRTTSITSVIKSKATAEMRYLDLLNDKETVENITLKENQPSLKNDTLQ